MQDKQEDPKDANDLESQPTQDFSIDQTVKPNVASLEPITWSAGEFVEHHKTKQWLGILILIIAAITVGVYFITGSIFSAAVIFIVGVTFIIVAARQPRTLKYGLSSEGIAIGERSHTYSEFKSFSVFDEGGSNSITLNPFKRFSPSTSIYFEESLEPKIMEFLGNYLPNEPVSKDPIDQLMHKIRY